MRHRLKKIYLTLLTPVVAGFIATYAIRCIHPSILLPAYRGAPIAPAIFILAALFGVAGPILVRSLFAHQQRGRRNVSHRTFFIFERQLIVISLAAPYLALIAYCLQLPRFHIAGTILLALYAIYYHFPSTERIALDRKIFRVTNSISQT